MNIDLIFPSKLLLILMKNVIDSTSDWSQPFFPQYSVTTVAAI